MFRIVEGASRTAAAAAAGSSASTSMGRWLQATQRIPAGTVLLEETPVVVSQPQTGSSELTC